MTKADNEVTVRRVKGSEIYRVVDLIIQAFSMEISIIGLDVRRLRGMARLYRMLSHFYPVIDALGVDFETILVAVADEEVVGEIHLVPHGKRLWSLDSAAVDSRFRGRGIYRKLLTEAVRYIFKRHGERIVTSLWTTNIAPVKVTNELKFEILEKKELLCLEDIHASFPETKRGIYVRSAEEVDAKEICKMCSRLYPGRDETCRAVLDDFSESLLKRLRNRMTQSNSRKWIMKLNDEIIGYAKVTYTSSEEAANLEYFYVLPLEGSSDHIGIFLDEILAFLHCHNVVKATVSVNGEWKDVIREFERRRFRSVASIYEMERCSDNIP